MKKLVTLLTLMTGAGLAFGQAIVHSPGTVSFQNTEAGKHLVTNFDGTLLLGTQYKAELVVVTGGTLGQFNGSLTPVPSSISSFKTATTSSPGTWTGANVDLSTLVVAGAPWSGQTGIGGVDIDNTTGGEAQVDYADPVTGANPYNVSGACTDGAGHYPIMVRVQVWDSTTGSDYNSASVKGQSKNYVYTQHASIPASPADTQMGTQPSFALVPEPSAIALSVLGVAGLLLIRRRK